MDRNDLISREDLRVELTKQIAYFGDRAHTQSDENEKMAYSHCKDGLLLARQIVDNAPAVEILNYDGQVVPDALHGWIYEDRQISIEEYLEQMKGENQ